MTDLTVADVLERAADLIEPEGKWTQGTEARDAYGNPVSLNSDDAQCWCLLGATGAADPDHFGHQADDVLHTLIGGSIAVWNDAPERTQAEVVAKLREAARLARERGQ